MAERSRGNAQKSSAPKSRWAVYLDTLTDNPPELGRMLPLTFEVELRNRGYEVVNQLEVINELQRTASMAYKPVTTNDRMRLQKAAEEVLHELRKDRMGKVLTDSESALKAFEAYVPAINREPQLMMYLSTLCAAQVQAHLKQRRADAADNQAARCIRLIPDADPDVSMFPPEVRDRYKGVRERLLRQKKATLAIDTVPRGRTQCAVRLNGRFIGYAPLNQVRLPDGQYDVQVECNPDRMSRVRRVSLTPSADVRLEVPIEFDEHLHTEDGVWFTYQSQEARNAYAAEDALRVMDYLALDHLMVVRFPFDVSKPEQMMVDRYDRPKDGSSKAVVTKRVETATARGEPPSVEEVGRVTDLLLGDGSKKDSAVADIDSKGVAPAAAAAIPYQPAPVETVQPSSNKPTPWLGLGLLGAGVAASGVAWVLQADWFNVKSYIDDINDKDANWQTLNDKLSSRQTQTLVAGAAGSALIGASMPFLIDKDTPLWLPVTLGVGGAAAVTVGAIYWSGHCVSATCDEPRIPMGPLLVMQGAALLMAPVVYTVSKLSEPTPELKPLAHLLERVQPVTTAGYSGVRYLGRF